MSNASYDAIIIGAGLSGLCSAAVLAKSGKKVLVVEMHDKVGGYATRFKRKEFIFDVSLHNSGALFEDEVLLNMLADLEVKDKVEYIPFDTYQHLKFPGHDMVIKRGVTGFIDELKKKFPEEQEGIDKIFGMMNDVREEFDEIERLDVALNDLEDRFPMLPIKFPMMVKLVYQTFGEFLDEYLKSDELKGIIGSQWWICSVPPERVASILYSVPIYAYFKYGGGYIKGTSQSLSDALAETIKSYGGSIELNTGVSKILTEEKEVRGIVTEKGETFTAPLVVSSVNAHETYLKMLDEEALPKRYTKKIKKLELSLSAISLYIGLDCPPEKVGIVDHNLTLFTSYDHNENFSFAEEGNYEKMFYSLTNYSAFDNSLCPEGEGVLSLISLDHIKNWENLEGDEYKKKKAEVTGILIKRLEKEFPAIREHIKHTELGTPVTMKRYTRNPEGAIYGSSQIVEQSGINRLQTQTPVKGLYITGAYIYPGAGYSSVVSSGYRTGKLILKSEGNEE